MTAENPVAKRRALVAEDEKVMARFVEVNLTRAGWEVDVVHSGSAAMELLQQRVYDLFVLDVTMPGYSGFEVTRMVRDRPETRTATVIILSAEDTYIDQLAGERAGADLYLTKPISAPDLMRAIPPAP